MDLITNQTRENHQFRPSESELGTFGFHSDELGGFEETEGLRERWEEKGGGGWVGGGGGRGPPLEWRPAGTDRAGHLLPPSTV